ncbi:EF-P 5-aminopentanol modification-associated protein YfmF [Zongyangia hominis]|uniref:Insulinase family protein n=1 Tax=Zongyangia hominis TaxID=2763677 RepID=A0A926E7T0_9FIRM|nr:insulinase family protein [Zongyangia hominis]MBC8569435.1 insulinase family protein [Zongyangia hominis]
MDQTLNRTKLLDQVYFNAIRDEKFKSNRISIHLLTTLSEDTAAQNAVVPAILRKGYAGCPDFTELNRKLARLYGAMLDADVRKIGDYQIINLSIQSLDDRFTMENEAVVKECCELLCGLLLDPKTVDGAFDPTDVELEKKYLIASIQAEINEKRSYAINRCLEIMCAGSPAGIGRYGSEAKAQEITPQSAFAAYERLIRSSQIEIIFCGSGDPAPAKELFQTAFAKVERAPQALPEMEMLPASEKVKRETDELDVTQAKMVLGFTADVGRDRAALAAARMMVAVYGGTPFSRLFLNVREKLSLCYYCAARFDRAKGTMMVDCGIEDQNRQKAYDEILRQLDVMKEGGFTDEEFDAAKLSMQNSFENIGDSLAGLESWYLGQIITGEYRSPKEETEQILAVSREAVVAAAQKVRLDTVYYLTGKGGSDHE